MDLQSQVRGSEWATTQGKEGEGQAKQPTRTRRQKKRAKRTTHGVFSVDEGVVDGHDLDFRVLGGVAEDDAANTAEAVDANLDGSHFACVYMERAGAWTSARESGKLETELVSSCGQALLSQCRTGYIPDKVPGGKNGEVVWRAGREEEKGRGRGKKMESEGTEGRRDKIVVSPWSLGAWVWSTVLGVCVAGRATGCVLAGHGVGTVETSRRQRPTTGARKTGQAGACIIHTCTARRSRVLIHERYYYSCY